MPAKEAGKKIVAVLTVAADDCIDPNTVAPAIAVGMVAVPEPGYVVLPRGVTEVGAEKT